MFFMFFMFLFQCKKCRALYRPPLRFLGKSSSSSSSWMCDVTFTFTEFNSSKSERYADSRSLWFLFSLLFSLSSFSYIPDVFVVLFSWKMDKSREVDEFRKSLQSLRSQWATAVAKWPTSPHTAKSPSLVRPLSFFQCFSFPSLLLEMKSFFCIETQFTLQILCGNKIDLQTCDLFDVQNGRSGTEIVTDLAGTLFSSQYFETSATNNIGIHELMARVVELRLSHDYFL